MRRERRMRSGPGRRRAFASIVGAAFCGAAFCGAAFWGAAPAAAAQEPHVMSAVADGQPWSMEAVNGRSGELTLEPDGTGRMRMGFMGADATWTAEPDGFCMTAGRLGTRCVSLQATADGYVAFDENAEEAFRLTR